MDLIYATIQLYNPVNPDFEPVDAQALVDAGALHLCIPEHISLQLQLKQLEQREVIVADGNRRLCPYVGPVRVLFQNRSCYTGALVLGHAVLLGAIPLEDMDLIVHPATMKLVVNPQNPNFPASTAMIL